MRQVEETWFSENKLLRGLYLDIGKLSHIRLVVTFNNLGQIPLYSKAAEYLVSTVLRGFRSFSCLSSGINLRKINEKSSSASRIQSALTVSLLAIFEYKSN